MEDKYTFRERLEQVHAPTRAAGVKPRPNEIVIDESWGIVISETAGNVIRTVALDLKEYFLVAMGVAVEVTALPLGRAGTHPPQRRIIIGVYDDFFASGVHRLPPVQGCRLVCHTHHIHIMGATEKTAAHGCYALEALLDERKGPYVTAMDRVLENRFSPRMIHSGWGLDVFPDNYLNNIAHSGFDSILIYYRRSDASDERIIEINNLIKRAANYGIGVYLYFNSFRHPVPEYDTMHPDDDGAEAYYDGFYGKAFKNHPGAVGCVLVGESCAFPSRDPETRSDVLNMSGAKRHPGWWPCNDYPRWLGLVQKVITKYRPDADIVFWTYNWGWAPEDKRLQLIEHLPSGISLLVTFDPMFETFVKGKTTEYCADYTIKLEGPGRCFVSEAQAAKARNLKLYAMSNTGGRTWDFGVAPYVPVPFQWAKRWDQLLAARQKWGLSGLMESHHYGWCPSSIASLGVYYVTSPETGNPNAFLLNLATRDFGAGAARHVMNAWRIWSRSIHLLPAGGADQYGPLRVGPSYPFHVTETDAPNIPPDPDVLSQRSIVTPFYCPGGDDEFTNRLIDHEMRAARKLMRHWQQGLEELESGRPGVTERGRAEYERMLALGRFIHHTLRTLLNIKRWWKLRVKLKSASSPGITRHLLEKMTVLAEEEIVNAKETVTILETNSGLGWEPRMGYLTDKSRLTWKIEQLERVLNDTFPEIRRAAGIGRKG